MIRILLSTFLIIFIVICRRGHYNVRLSSGGLRNVGLFGPSFSLQYNWRPPILRLISEWFTLSSGGKPYKRVIRLPLLYLS
uniref:Uncharacterized protein n=2 Tax=Picea TaxID=3328 RepID=A0A101M4M3_PICGL|nr:hypothetical protein ABT39_MTgene710 [Picea glauca]QHR90211.1 hypothetical protein Q903MT_gene4234 [Picea sitchensis]